MLVTTRYDKSIAQTYDADRFTSVSGRRIHDIELGLLRTALRSVPSGSNILEVGCGTGRLLLEVCDMGYELNGLDASPAMLSRFRENARHVFPEAGIILGESARVPCPDDSFDFVYCMRLLNQTGSPEYALSTVAEMIRVARPDDYILVEFMNYYRPRFMGRRVRLSPGKVVERFNERNVRLKPHEVIERARQSGGALVWCRGAFFLGMSLLHMLPVSWIGVVSAGDQVFSDLLPSLCSRCYALFQKMG